MTILLRSRQQIAKMRDAGRLVRLVDPAEVLARNEQLAQNPEAPVARFDWIWSFDVECAMVEG